MKQYDCEGAMVENQPGGFTDGGDWVRYADALALEADRDALIEERANLQALLSESCSGHGCVFGHPGGMGTNGGCSCLKSVADLEERMALQRRCAGAKQAKSERDALRGLLAEVADCPVLDNGGTLLGDAMLARIKEATEC